MFLGVLSGYGRYGRGEDVCGVCVYDTLRVRVWSCLLCVLCGGSRVWGERHEAYVGAEYLQSVELRVVVSAEMSTCRV